MTHQLNTRPIRLGFFALLCWGILGSATPARALACAPAGPVVYRNGFEGAVGPEWSNASVDTTPSGRRFLGQFGNDTVTLTLACLPAHRQVILSFDLYVIRSWVGNIIINPVSGGTIGPNVW